MVDGSITLEQVLIDDAVSIEELHQRTKIPVERLGAIVGGRWTPSPEDREAIAQALGRDMDKIVWGHTMNERNVRYHRFGFPDE